MRTRSNRERRAMFAKMGRSSGVRSHSRRNPRVVIGKGRLKSGKKVRVRYPSMMSGYITHTFVSRAEAKRFIKNLSPSPIRNRAKIIEV